MTGEGRAVRRDIQLAVPSYNEAGEQRRTGVRRDPFCRLPCRAWRGIARACGQQEDASAPGELSGIALRSAAPSLKGHESGKHAHRAEKGRGEAEADMPGGAVPCVEGVAEGSGQQDKKEAKPEAHPAAEQESRRGAPNRTLPKRCWLSACRVKRRRDERYHSPNVFTRKTSSEPSRDHSSDGRAGRPGRWAKNPQCILTPCQRMSRSSTDSTQCALLCVGGSM